MKWIHPPNSQLSHLKIWGFPLVKGDEPKLDAIILLVPCQTWGGYVIPIYFGRMSSPTQGYLSFGGCSKFEGMRCLFLSKMGGKSKTGILKESLGSWYLILLMEEILHHVGCIKSSEKWDEILSPHDFRIGIWMLPHGNCGDSLIPLMSDYTFQWS